MEHKAREYREVNTPRLRDLLGPGLVEHLSVLQKSMGTSLYLAGGTVRDILLDRPPVDIDLTVPNGARKWASELCRRTGGAYVPLGRDEDAARVVWQGRDIDFSSFREGAETIEEELGKRDMTVNSMAVSLDGLFLEQSESGSFSPEIIDPLGGIADVVQRVVRMTSRDAFLSDPLRLLRVYRFAATLAFSVDPETAELVAAQKELIAKPAAERLSHELNLIMESGRARRAIGEMAACGLLFEILPELLAGVGMEQPASHHLDVFDHCLATLARMETLQADPSSYFKTYDAVMKSYLAAGRHRLQLCWAALLHDLGKPATLTIDEDRGRRITFYNHDLEGARQVEKIGRRLRWSAEDTRAVSDLVANHMRPFHLGNVQRQGDLSLKACLRLVKKTGGSLPGLFLLAMADALAGRGEGRPENIEKEVDALFTRMEDVRREHVEPVRSRPRLLSGRDLIDELHLEPGPVFRQILDSVEEAQMEKRIATRQEALDLARQFLQDEV